MNMIDIQDKLKSLSEDQLIREMQAPSGQAPQFLVLSEITRRKKMRDGFKAQEAGQSVPTVAEEVVASAGVPQHGLGQMASAMAPESSIAQNTGIGSLPVQRMYAGGQVKKMAEGGRIVVRNGQRFRQTEDGRLIPETRSMSILENLQGLPEEIAAIPGQLGSAARDFSAGFADEMNQDLISAGDAAMRRQMAEDVYGMRAGPDTSYRYPEMPTVDTSPMDRVAMALEGRTGFSTVPQVDLDLVDLNADRAAAMQAGQDASMLGMVPPIGLPPEVGAGRSAFPTMTAITPAAGTPFALPPQPPGPSFEERGRSTPVQSEVPQGYGDAIMAPNWREGMPAPEDMPDYEIPQVLKDAYSMAEGAINPLSRIRDFALDLIPDGNNPRADRDQQGFGDITPEEAQGLPPEPPADTTETPNTIPLVADTGGGGTGGTGGTGGASQQGSYVSELEDALKRAERTKEQDKWLALAQTGLALMASDQPTLGGAIGEAGQVGIEAFRSARDTYEDSRMSILDAIAAQRAAAARAAGGGGGGGRGGGAATISDALKKVRSDLDNVLMEVDDPMTGGKTFVPRPGFEDIATNLSTLYSDLLRQQYGISSPTLDLTTPQ